MLLYTLGLLFLEVPPSCAVDASHTAIQRAPVPGEIVVCFETAEAQTDLNEFIHAWELPSIGPAAAATTLSPRPLMQWRQAGAVMYTNIVKIEIAIPGCSEAILHHIRSLPDVVWCAPNYRYGRVSHEFIPNDPQYPDQHHHQLMQNEVAWDITLGESEIIVAIPDDGVDLFHPDLAPNIWINPGEVPGNGIDDDGNGYIDDTSGWDFSSNDSNPNPSPSSWQGTHSAGCAAARIDNGIGVAGTAGAATIMRIRWYGSGHFTSTVIADSFAYAIDNGARIVSTGYNIDQFVGDPTVTAAFSYAYDQGGLHLNSAGNNDSANAPRQEFQQTLFVAATDEADAKASFSNYGRGIDLAAPGVGILSTVPGNNYAVLSGTSAAVPLAAGASALIWSAHPTWTRDQVAAQLLATADNIDGLNPEYAGLLGAGRVNSGAALTTTIGPPQVLETSALPDDGGVGNLPGSTFSIRFDQVMDPPTVNDQDAITMSGAGPDGVFGTGDDIEIPLIRNQYFIATNDIWCCFQGHDIVHGLYQINADAAILTNPFGTPLDGNGDGSGGDSWESSFWYLAPCREDLNGDDAVGVVDLLVLLSGWGASGPGDVSADGVVSVEDLLRVLAQWGPCPVGVLNDVCTGAIEVGNGKHPYTTIDATTEGPIEYVCGQVHYDLWYTYTALADGTLTVTLDPLDHPADLLVYQGCGSCCDLPIPVERDCDTVSPDVTLDVVENGCYLIRIGGAEAGDLGQGVMTIDGPA